MNTPRSQQIEFDTFARDNKSGLAALAGLRNETNEGASVHVAFSHQSVIVIFLCVIMLLVASFVLGVEKGKLIARNSIANAVRAPWAPSAPPPASLNAAPAARMPVATQTNAAPVLISAAAEKTVLSNTPVPAPAAATNILAITKPSYAIQVASVKSKSAAQKLADALKQKGWPSTVKTSGDYVIVLAGSYAKREDALPQLQELKRTYTDCFIKKI